MVTGNCEKSSNRPMRHSIEIIVTAITTRVTRSASTPTAPLPNTSARASTSLVSRVSNLPTGVRSWKRSDRARAWEKRSSRMRAVSRCPTNCTLKLCSPCRQSRVSTASSSSTTIEWIAWGTGRPRSQAIVGSRRSTEIAWPTNSGCTAPAKARGISSSRVRLRRRRSRPR